MFLVNLALEKDSVEMQMRLAALIFLSLSLVIYVHLCIQRSLYLYCIS